MKKDYARPIQKIGGGKFIAVILMTGLLFILVTIAFLLEWKAMILDSSRTFSPIWNMITVIAPFYFAAIVGWAGIEVWNNKQMAAEMLKE